MALSVDDIRTLMSTPVVAGTAPPATSTTGLVAAYNFNDGTATDITGLGHNGVLNGPRQRGRHVWAGVVVRREQ